MIPSINQGDILKCLKCNDHIEINSDTLKFEPTAEYIICPHCKVVYDIQAYHIYGEKIEKGDTL